MDVEVICLKIGAVIGHHGSSRLNYLGSHCSEQVDSTDVQRQDYNSKHTAVSLGSHWSEQVDSTDIQRLDKSIYVQQYK